MVRRWWWWRWDGEGELERVGRVVGCGCHSFWFLMTMNMNQDVLGTTVVSSRVCAVDCYEDCFVRNACNTRMN